MLTEREATNVPFLTERRVQAGDAGPAVGEFCAHPGCILPAGPADCSFRLKGAVSSGVELAPASDDKQARSQAPPRDRYARAAAATAST